LSIIVLGLDPANLTGYALGTFVKDKPKIIDFGTVDFPQTAKFLRCSNVRAAENWLTQFIKEKGVTHLCAEDAGKAFMQVASIVSHSRYAAIIDLVAEKLKIGRVKSVNPSTLKSFACDNGHAKKEQMIRSAQLLYGVDVTDDNAADACHVAMFAMHHLKKNKPPF